jgi:agmatine deiminase
MTQLGSHLGYRMPAEWEPHRGTILTWPHIPSGMKDHPHWPGYYKHIPQYWARMVKELEQGEEVHLIIHDQETEDLAKSEMKKMKVQGDRVTMHRIPNDFVWARDHGPIVVKNAQGDSMFLNWKHNGWGGQWEYERDDQIPATLARELGEKSRKIDMVLEGGSIDVNGCGTLLTTENCLLNPNRNPGLTKQQIEAALMRELGVTHILWLGEGIQGDDTSGHVDDLTRFVGPSTVVTIVTDNVQDPDFAPLQENLRRLQTMTDQDGSPLTVRTIRQPSPVFIEGKPTRGDMETGHKCRIPASYANFYIGNECVLLPIWDDSHDADAMSVLQECFPTRRIVPINSTFLTWGLGSFHCVTQQIPA